LSRCEAICAWALRRVEIRDSTFIAFVSCAVRRCHAAFENFVNQPQPPETKAMNSKSRDLYTRNAQAQIASQRLNEFRAGLQSQVEEYEELKALLPEQRELTMVLQNVQEQARNNGLVLGSSSPRTTCSRKTITASE